MIFHKFYLTIFSIFIFKSPCKNEVSGGNSNISHAGLTRGVPGQKPNTSLNQCHFDGGDRYGREGGAGQRPVLSSDNIVHTIRSKPTQFYQVKGRVVPKISASFSHVLTRANRVWQEYTNGVEVDFRQLQHGYRPLHDVLDNIPPHVFLYGLLLGFAESRSPDKCLYLPQHPPRSTDHAQMPRAL